MSGSAKEEKKSFLPLIVVAGALLAFAAYHQSARPRFGCGPSVPLATATALESAVNSFFIEYGKLPDSGNRVSTNSPAGIELLNILLGFKESSARLQNFRQIKFIVILEGSGLRNGLIYSSSGTSVEGLFDPWGNPYTVIFDTDHDEILRFKLGSKEIELKGRRVAVFSPGKDGKPGTKDDVLTW